MAESPISILNLRSRRIKFNTCTKFLECWSTGFWGNSSHVLDQAFYLGGLPSDWRGWSGGGVDWHPSSSRFCGSGITEQGAFFSYIADWEAPGRWGGEVMTRKRRFIFRPREKLQVTPLGLVKVESVELSDQLTKILNRGFIGKLNRS